MSCWTPQAWSAERADCARAADTSQRLAAAQASRRITPASLPEIVEVEPIVGRHAAIEFEPFDIVAERLVGMFGAGAHRHVVGRRQALEEDIISSAAAIDTEHEDDRA